MGRDIDVAAMQQAASEAIGIAPVVNREDPAAAGQTPAAAPTEVNPNLLRTYW
jgi:hypothetical protein